MRRNNVTIMLEAKNGVDEEALSAYGEKDSLNRQYDAIHDMLEEYGVFEVFDVNIIVSLDEEE